MPSPQQQQHRSHSAVALHEAMHSAFGASQGLEVLRVDVRQGYCDIPMPYTPAGLRAAFRDPPYATGWLVTVLGVLGVQAFAEGRLFPGRRYNGYCWDDVRQYEAYQAAYAALPFRLVDYNRVLHTKAPWEALGAAARAAVASWYHRPLVPLALLALAGALAAAGHVDARGWQWLWARDFATPLRAQTGGRKYWVTHPSDSTSGTCEQCAAIAAENAGGVAEGEGFATGIPGDTVDGPPAHPRCRCTVEVR